jgi:hypothetical protein
VNLFAITDYSARPVDVARQRSRCPGPVDHLVQGVPASGRPDPAEMAARYGAETPMLDWRERLVCSRCGSRQTDMAVTGTEQG